MTAYRGISDPQANAEALAKRASPFSADHTASVRRAWDAGRRTPRDLRHAALMVQALAAAEIPMRMTEGNDQLADDGVPKIATDVERMVFEGPHGLDVPKDQDGPALGYRRTPFRARLDELERSPDERDRRHASLVRQVAMGGRSPIQAAIGEGVPLWAARDAADLVLRRFLASVSDVVVLEPRPT